MPAKSGGGNALRQMYDVGLPVTSVFFQSGSHRRVAINRLAGALKHLHKS
jgi:hypothetical protein